LPVGLDWIGGEYFTNLSSALDRISEEVRTQLGLYLYYPLVIWDNRITQHSSVCDHLPHRRHMQRFPEVQR